MKACAKDISLAELVPPPPERFRLRSAADFALVEAYVSGQMLGGGDRCAFLRSAVFTRFRTRCLYRPSEARARCWGPNGILLEFARDAAGGGHVTVSVLDHISQSDFDASWGARPKMKLHS